MRFVLIGSETAPRTGRIVAESAKAAGLEVIQVRSGAWGSSVVPLYRYEGGAVEADLWTPDGGFGLGPDDHFWALELPPPPAGRDYLRREWEALTFAFLRECPARVWNRVDLVSQFWVAGPLPFLVTGLSGLRLLRAPELAFAPGPPGPGWAPWPRAAAGGADGEGVFWRADRPGPLHLALLVGDAVLLFRIEPPVRQTREAPAELAAELRALGARHRLDYLEVVVVPCRDGWTVLSVGSRPLLGEAVAGAYREPFASAIRSHLSVAVFR